MEGDFYGCATFPSPIKGSGNLFRTAPGYFEVLYSFTPVTPLSLTGKNTDGANCYEPLVETNPGVFYGSASRGGANGSGVVFRYTVGAGTFETLHSFGALDANGFNADGGSPQARLTRGWDGGLYSTALSGGAAGTGVVYRISESGANFRVLHSFSATDAGGNNADGANPFAGVLLDEDGSLIGATLGGGNMNNGTLYRIEARDCHD